MILKILGLILFFELYNYRTLFDVRESKCEVGRKGRISTTSIGFSISIPRSNWSRLWTNRVVKFRYGERNSAIKEGLAHIKGEKYIKEYRISGSLSGYRPVSFTLDDHRFPWASRTNLSNKFQELNFQFDILQILLLPIIIIIIKIPIRME